jgi:ferredoxin
MPDQSRESEPVELAVVESDRETVLEVASGANLRRVLLEGGFDVYGPVSRVINCGGRGLCSTCTVCIDAGAPEPTHWHDELAVRLGYPRLSCQVTVERDVRVRLLDKLVWGQLLPRRYDPDAPPESDAGACQE